MRSGQEESKRFLIYLAAVLISWEVAWDRHVPAEVGGRGYQGARHLPIQDRWLKATRQDPTHPNNQWGHHELA